MKKPLHIFATIVLAVLFLYACGSTIRTWNSSIVTITIGESRQEAVIHAERATPWKKLQYFLADIKIVPEAQAYIPSIVQVIVVTISAPDMTTIAAIDDVSNKTSTAIRIEVSNGKARQFLVEGFRGLDSQIYYRGAATTDLDGTNITLPVNMNFVGSGIFVDALKGSDISGTGSQANPYKTISMALSKTTGTDAILVAPGTYTPVGAGGSEIFPLQLKPGTALICRGTGANRTIMNPLSTDAVYGADLASIDNCDIIVGLNFNGINDRPGGQSVALSRITINACNVFLSGAPTGLMNGIVLANDSRLLETAVTGSALFAPVTGIQVLSGAPAIKAGTIASISTGTVGTGIDITASAGNAAITDTLVKGNAIGIAVAAAGTPVISGSTFESNSTGVSISAGSALISAGTFTSNIYGIAVSSGSPSITSSTFHGSTYGIWVTGGSPSILTNDISSNSYGVYITTSTGSNPVVHDSSLSCNIYYNLYSSTTSTIDVSNNSWEHYPPIVSDQSIGCTVGDDICYGGPAPLYQPYHATVPGVCVRMPF